MKIAAIKGVSDVKYCGARNELKIGDYLTYAYEKGKAVLQNISTELENGKMYAIPFFTYILQCVDSNFT